MRRFIALTLALLVTACSTPAGGDGSEYRETDYKTGSNLPQKRNRDMPVEVKSVDPASIPRTVSPASRSGG